MAGLVLLAALGPFGPTLAREPLPGILGTDDRVPIEPDRYPWSAVGRVNYAGHRDSAFCTGTLVTPDRVLTAAHCLHDPKSKSGRQPGSIHFVASWARGEYQVHRRGARFVLAPGYDPTKSHTFEMSSRDWALIVLDKPVTEVKPIPILPLDLPTVQKRAGKQGLIRVGYAKDRPHLPTRSTQCGVTGSVVGHELLLHDCDSTKGGSGSPLLLADGDSVGVAAVVVGVLTKSDGISFNTAVPAGAAALALRR